MKRRIFAFMLIVSFLILPVRAEPIRWVDFGVPYGSLKYAMDLDIATFDQEVHLPWTRVLAVAACRTGGKCPLSSVKKAAEDLKTGANPEEFLGSNVKYYNYYLEAYEAVLGGMLEATRWKLMDSGGRLTDLKHFRP